MGRVSLTESYDDRSVISKLNEMDKRVTENTTVVTSAEASAKASAQAAQETADRFAGSVGAVVQNANQQINASKAQVDQAKAEVDETVTTVAQAVQTANNASASAQQSANTVATYDTRLTAVEDADTQNVKLDGAQTITGQKTFSKDIIVKHGSTPVYIVRNDVASTSSPTRATDFGYTFRDKDNNETGTFFQHIGTDKNSYLCARTKSWATGSRKDCEISLINNADGSRYVTVSPTPTATVPSNAVVTKGYVESTDGETNNILHRGTTEVITNQKLGMVNGSTRQTNLSDKTLAIGEISGAVIADEYIQMGYVYTDRSGMVIGYYEGTPTSVVKNNTHVLSPLISHQKIGIIKQDGKYLLCIALSRAYSSFPTVNVMYCGSAYNPLEVVMYKTPTTLDVTYANFTGGAEIS